MSEQVVETSDDGLCDDCPPAGYPTDKTRCLPCPRRAPVPDIAAVAGKLTKAQREVLFALVPRKGLVAQEIAHLIGRRPSKDYRLTVGRAAMSLCNLGLAHWIRSRPDQWGVRMFFPNETGLALRQNLLENGGG